MSNAITISVLGDVKNLVSGVDKSTGALGKLGSAGKAIGKTVAVGLAAATAGVIAYGAESLKSLVRIERINAQTASVIKSTGNAAGVTSKHVQGLAGRLENLTATEAETTQENANLLLTFTNVRNEAGKGNKIFDQTVSTFVDMQRAIPSASMTQLGKALNDPVKGVTALTKVGVTFTQAQKDQIKTLVDSGKTMAAQKVILGELNKEFGGAGEAFAGTTAGKIELAKHAFGTLGETIFANLLPPLGAIATAATKGLAWLNTQAPAIQRFASSITAKLGPALSFVKDAFGQLAAFIGPKLGPAFAQVSAAVDQLGAAIGPKLAAAFAIVKPGLDALHATIVGTVLPAVQSFAGYIAANVVPIVTQIAGVFVNNVLPTLARFAAFLYGTVYPAVVRIAISVGEKLKPVLDAVFRVVQTSLIPTLKKVAAKFEEWRPTIQKVTLVVVKIVGKLLEFAAVVLSKVLPPLIKLAGFILAKVVPAALKIVEVVAKVIGFLVKLGAGIGTAVGKVVGFGATLRDLVAKGLDKVVDAVKALPGKIGQLGGKLLEAGKNIIGKFIQGLSNAGAFVGDIAGAIFQAVKDVINGAINKLNDLLEITIDKGPIHIHIDPPDIGTIRAVAATAQRTVYNAVSKGLLKGLRNGEAGVNTYLKKLNDRVAKAYLKRTGEKLTAKQIAGYTKAYAGQVKSLLSAARAYAEAEKAHKDYVSAVKANAVSFAEITGVGVIGENGEQSAASITQGLRDRLNAIRDFTAKLRKLIKAGINKTTLQQIIDAGVDGGAATLNALVTGSAGAIRDSVKDVNHLQQQINAAAAGLGNTTANAVLGPLDPKRVQQAAKRAGDVIANILKKRLGIRINVVAGDGPDRTRTKVTTPARTQVADTHARSRREPLEIAIELSAEQLSAIERGRRISVDLKAYHRAGGQ